MPRETDPKPERESPEPDHKGAVEEEKNVDRDGRERQPTEHTDHK